MATGLCNQPGSPLRLAPPLSRSSPPSALVCVGSSVGSALRTPRREPRGPRLYRAVRGGGSPAGGRFLVRCGIASVNQAEFGEVVLKSELPVLVEFVADWCGPCRLISPVIEWASQIYPPYSLIRRLVKEEDPEFRSPLAMCPSPRRFPPLSEI